MYWIAQTSLHTRMTYDIVYTADGSETFNTLEPTEQTQLQNKLDQIAGNEYRDPRDWDFQQMEGRADGRLSIGRGLRVFVDIDDTSGVIRIHFIGRRENLYT